MIQRETAKHTQNYTQNRRKMFSVSFAFLFGVSFALPLGACAAQLNIVSQTQEIAVGQQFQVNLFLNTEGEAINAVEGKLVFPGDLLEIKEIRDGSSIVNFWVEKPRSARMATNEKTNSNEFVFVGVIPGGYNDNNGFLFSATLEVKKEGNGVIEIRDAKTLLNDGKGTATNVKLSNFQFNIREVGIPKEVRLPEIKDTEPPEDFKPETAQDPNIFGGKYFLAFVTQDKGSGLLRYEVAEERAKPPQNRTPNYAEMKWIEAESPYVLKDQKLRSYIYVKAVDRAGNERVVVVEPRYPLRWYEAWWIWSIITSGFVILYIIGKILWKKSRNIHKT